MAEWHRKRELGRGERVLPGVFRLRLPLPWPGVPHCNAWAVAAGEGIVLFDTGLHEPGSMAQLERALAMCGRQVEDIRLLVCTHAHSDHYGQAAAIVQRTGCELWMHPNYAHGTDMAENPEAALARRIEIGRQSGVPEEPLRRYASQADAFKPGIAGVIAPDRELVDGVIVETDLGPWRAYETPGHAPSHVCLFQPERRVMISGDHLLGRISLHFDYGFSDDPMGKLLDSLDIVERLDARLCLPGHGRTFTDVRAHIDGNRMLVGERLQAALSAIVAEPLTAFELVPRLHASELSAFAGPLLLMETLATLRHLEVAGRACRLPGEPERWTAVASDKP